MATRKQKQELIDTLKFTPVKARVYIQGYGGECYIGRVTREEYEAYKQGRVDIEQYASDWDDDDKWNDIPQNLRIFPPGSPYDCDNLCHASGATLDDSSMITIEDENGNTIWESTLDIANLVNKGVEVEAGGDVWESADESDGTVVFWGAQGEKGCFFDGEFILKAPFDPNKLHISYSEADGWQLTSGVQYDDEDIEGYDGYSTTGKWCEYKFHIIGDEEVYEGVERGEDNEEEDEELDYDHSEANFDDGWDAEEELSKIPVPKILWQPEGTNPSEPGEYDVLIDAPWPLGGPGRAEWTGKTWKSDGKKIKVSQWGLSGASEDIPVLEGEEFWASKAIDEADEVSRWEGHEMTDWWPAADHPQREGRYQIMVGEWPFPAWATWSRKKGWQDEDGAITNLKSWRGLSKPAK